MNNKRSNNSFIVLLFILCTSLSFVGFANNTHAEVSQLPDQLTEKLTPQNDKTISKEIDRLITIITQYQKSLQREGITEAEVETIIKDVNGLQTKALVLEQEIHPKLSATRELLTDLGAAPKEGEPPESAEVKNRRDLLLKEQREYNGYIKSLKVVQTKSKQLIEQFNSTQRDKIYENVAERSYSIFSPSLWVSFASEIGNYANSIILFFSDSFHRITSDTEIKIEAFAILALIILATSTALSALFFLFRFARDFLIKRNIDQRAKTSIQALFNIFKFAIIPIVIIGLFLSLVSNSGLANSVTSKIIDAVFYAVSSAISVFVFSYIFFNPKNEQQRILQISNKRARQIFTLTGIIAVVYFFHEVVDNTSLVDAFPVEVRLSFHAIFSLITALITASILFLITKDHREQELTIEPRQALLSWRFFRPILWVLTLGIFTALAMGYIRLAEFIADYILTMSVTTAFYWLLLEIIDSTLLPLFHHDSAFTKDLSNFFGAKTNRIRQIGVILIGAIRIITIVLFFAVLLSPLGFQSSDWFIWLKQAFFGFTIGNIVISPATILFVVLIGILGFSATRAIQNWLAQQYLPTTDLDLGVQNSISTVFGYTGTVAVCLFAASYAGLNFQNLAIIFGALSVGIGFGLRDIIGNFVSGLILLAERPVKVGDWIITSGGEGTVRNISVRSTQIETFDRATIIVPNQNLITEPVTNWTFRSELGRIKIPVGVGYDSDAETVRDLLIQCAKDHEGILKYPEPHVLFLNMGADALELELRAYLKNISNGALVKSDLRFTILKALREAKVSIPYPQRHIHIEGLDKLIKSKNDDKK